MIENLIIGSDHGGFHLKESLRGFIEKLGVKVENAGTYDDSSVNYVTYADRVAGDVSRGRFHGGILLCGTGLGMSIAANRFPNVRAALCNDIFLARMSREHNDSNVLVMGGRVIGEELAREIVRTWLGTPFQGGRHMERIQSIENLSVCNVKGASIE
ncbi:MAG: ribose 5-phosphate isomerase B [Desulfamplus sp.]|nr:ribose 5-phosphate isomerase B [Desulfamplus sp.]